MRIQKGILFRPLHGRVRGMGQGRGIWRTIWEFWARSSVERKGECITVIEHKQTWPLQTERWYQVFLNSDVSLVMWYYFKNSRESTPFWDNNGNNLSYMSSAFSIFVRKYLKFLNISDIWKYLKISVNVVDEQLRKALGNASIVYQHLSFYHVFHLKEWLLLSILISWACWEKTPSEDKY